MNNEIQRINASTALAPLEPHSQHNLACEIMERATRRKFWPFLSPQTKAVRQVVSNHQLSLVELECQVSIEGHKTVCEARLEVVKSQAKTCLIQVEGAFFRQTVSRLAEEHALMQAELARYGQQHDEHAQAEMQQIAAMPEGPVRQARESRLQNDSECYATLCAIFNRALVNVASQLA